MGDGNDLYRETNKWLDEQEKLERREVCRKSAEGSSEKFEVEVEEVSGEQLAGAVAFLAGFVAVYITTNSFGEFVILFLAIGLIMFGTVVAHKNGCEFGFSSWLKKNEDREE